MVTLKTKELKEGCIYLCNLSNRKVLITSKEEKTIEQPSGKRIEIFECFGLSYSDNGIYDTVVIWDNMLSPINNLN